MLYLELDFGRQVAERIHRVSNIINNLDIAAKQRKPNVSELSTNESAHLLLAQI